MCNQTNMARKHCVQVREVWERFLSKSESLHCEVRQVKVKRGKVWATAELWTSDVAQLTCEWTNHQLIGAIFIKLMFHRSSCSYSHQCKKRVVNKPGTTLRAIWLKKMALYYHQAFSIFLLGFHWIKTAIIIIYIFMFSTINIFLLMKMIPECWVP